MYIFSSHRVSFLTYHRSCSLAHFEAMLDFSHLLAHNNINQICYFNAEWCCTFSDNLTTLGVTLILLWMVRNLKGGK